MFSATVFAQLKKSRRAGRPARLVAFGDPDYSAFASTGRAAASARQRGLDLRPLPEKRREVPMLEALYPDAAQVYVGAEATEERVKEGVKLGSLIHCACHGLADESSPLDSSLALRLPGDGKPARDNGSRPGRSSSR